VLRRFASYARLDGRYAANRYLELGVHAIRIVQDATIADMRGLITPEGMHQDGFDYVCSGATPVITSFTFGIHPRHPPCHSPRHPRHRPRFEGCTFWRFTQEDVI
jgi:hypothetical protein